MQVTLSTYLLYSLVNSLQVCFFFKGILAFHKSSRPSTTTDCADDKDHCDNLKKNPKEMKPIIE